jgi:hypothetical protein
MQIIATREGEAAPSRAIVFSDAEADSCYDTRFSI